MAILFYIIPALIGLVALGLIVYTYAKKMPTLAALDLEAMPEHRQKQKKANLVSDRLNRKLSGSRSGARVWFNRLAAALKKSFSGVMVYLQDLEKRYRAAAEVGATNDEDVAASAASVITLVQEGDALAASEKYNEAEKKYIAAVAIDPRSLSAYKGLVTVYVALNDTEHAIATLQFMEQLDPKDETTYRRLAELYRETDKIEEAMDAMEQALALAPNNPKNLDAFIEIAILNKLKYRAQSSLDKLKEVNPENQKLQKYQEEINQLWSVAVSWLLCLRRP